LYDELLPSTYGVRSRVAPERSNRLEHITMAGPLFLVGIFAIMWLSASLLAHDIRAYHDAELRIRRCPKRL